jgi:hypothetical protein
MFARKKNWDEGRIAKTSCTRVRGGNTKRSGWVLMVALVAIGVFLGISSVGIRWMLRSRQELRVERDLLQVELLGDAGRTRAFASYVKDREYRGEVWLDQFDLGSGRAMRVEIREDLEDTARTHGENVNGKVFEIVVRMQRRDQSPASIQRTKRVIFER